MSINESNLTYPEILCPQCYGEQYFDEVYNITIEGDVWTREVPCDLCHGAGWIYAKDGEDEDE